MKICNQCGKEIENEVYEEIDDKYYCYDCLEKIGDAYNYNLNTD
jgi:hypothetical protein